MTNVVKIEVYPGLDGQWYWRAKAGNGEIVAHGEAYTKKTDALKAVQQIWPSEIPVESEAE